MRAAPCRFSPKPVPKGCGCKCCTRWNCCTRQSLAADGADNALAESSQRKSAKGPNKWPFCSLHSRRFEHRRFKPADVRYVPAASSRNFLDRLRTMRRLTGRYGAAKPLRSLCCFRSYESGAARAEHPPRVECAKYTLSIAKWLQEIHHGSMDRVLE